MFGLIFKRRPGGTGLLPKVAGVMSGPDFDFPHAATMTAASTILFIGVDSRRSGYGDRRDIEALVVHPLDHIVQSRWHEV
jgi:hypothetical protein